MGLSADDGSLTGDQLLRKLAAGRVEMALLTRGEFDQLHAATPRPLELLPQPFAEVDYFLGIRRGIGAAQRAQGEAWWSALTRMRDLPAYVDAGTQVLVGAGGRAAALRQHGAALAERVVEVTAERELDLGERKLRLMPMPSSHARDMLVAHDPAAATIYQGDLFYLPEVGPVPPAFEVSEELNRLITTRQLKVEHIVGIHGRSGGPADLAQSLQLRRKACQLQVC